LVDRLVPVLVRSMKYSEQDISLLMGNVEEVSTVVFATHSLEYQGKYKRNLEKMGLCSCKEKSRFRINKD
jgi:hypothetical protein